MQEIWTLWLHSPLTSSDVSLVYIFPAIVQPTESGDYELEPVNVWYPWRPVSLPQSSSLQRYQGPPLCLRFMMSDQPLIGAVYGSETSFKADFPTHLDSVLLDMCWKPNIAPLWEKLVKSACSYCSAQCVCVTQSTRPRSLASGNHHNLQ
jgi:hypothetical protein